LPNSRNYLANYNLDSGILKMLIVNGKIKKLKIKYTPLKIQELAKKELAAPVIMTCLMVVL